MSVLLMFRLLVCLHLILPVLSSPVALRLSIGTVIGHLEQAGHSQAEVYRAIPYAQPPVGPRRFESPEALPNSTDRIETNKTSFCPGLTSFYLTNTSNEDCLHLKVIVPLDKDGNRHPGRLPVVFWVHGGSFNDGSKMMYTPPKVIEHFSSRGIIFAAPNYRLGSLGFLTALHPDLPGNYGLEDQMKALKLLLENAAAFGVDPARVTVAGESAGAASASILAVSPRTEGLFQSVILVSGSSQANWAVRSHSSEIASARFINACGCNRSTVADMKECMKLVNLKCTNRAVLDVYRGAEKSWYEGMRMGVTVFTPVVDVFRGNDSIIPLRIETLVAQRARMPVLFSFTAEERSDWTLKNVLDGDFVKHGNKSAEYLDKMVESLISWNVKSRKYVIKAVKDTYLKDLDHKTNAAAKLGELLTRDMTSAIYEEALIYDSNGQTVYALENKIHSDRPTSHGHDSGFVFGSHNFSTGCAGCDEELGNKFAEHYTEILASFIVNRSIPWLQPFTKASRSAYRVDSNGSRPTDWHTDGYYFWRRTLPLLESLHIYPDAPMVLPVCQEPLDPLIQESHSLVAIAAASIVCMMMCSLFVFLFWRSRRSRQNRQQMAASEVPLASE